MALKLEKLVYTPSEVAALLGIHTNTVYKLIHAGTLGSVNAGRKILIPAMAIEAYLGKAVNSNTGKTTSPEGE